LHQQRCPGACHEDDGDFLLRLQRVAAKLVDVLEVSISGMTAQIAVAADGIVSHIELWTDTDAEPCLVRFGLPHPDDPRGLPTRFDVSRGDEMFGTLVVEPTAEEQP
jgi:hypothetical protein